MTDGLYTWIWFLQRHLQMTLSFLSRAIDSASVQWNSLRRQKVSTIRKTRVWCSCFPSSYLLLPAKVMELARMSRENVRAVWGYCSRNSRNFKGTNVHPFFIPLDSSSPFSFESTSSVGWAPSEDFVAAIVVVNVLRSTALLIPESTTNVRLHNNYFYLNLI